MIVRVSNSVYLLLEVRTPNQDRKGLKVQLKPHNLIRPTVNVSSYLPERLWLAVLIRESIES